MCARSECFAECRLGTEDYDLAGLELCRTVSVPFALFFRLVLQRPQASRTRPATKDWCTMESPNLPTYSAVDPARLSIGPLAQSPSLISGPASPSILTAVLPPPSPRLEHDASLAFDVPQEKEKLDVQDDAPGKRPSDDSAGATPLLYIMVTILLSAALTMLNKYIFVSLVFGQALDLSSPCALLARPLCTFLTLYSFYVCTSGASLLRQGRSDQGRMALDHRTADLIWRVGRLLIASSNVTLPFRDWGSWTRHILPVGMLYAASIVFSNLAYLSLTVPFVQMYGAVDPLALAPS